MQITHSSEAGGRSAYHSIFSSRREESRSLTLQQQEGGVQITHSSAAGGRSAVVCPVWPNGCSRGWKSAPPAGNRRNGRSRLDVRRCGELTLTGTRHFAIHDGTRGGGGSPWCFQSKRRRAYQRDKRIALDEYSRLIVRFLDSTLKFDPVIRGQRSNFPEIGNFSDLQVYISKSIDYIETKPSSSCSTFNSEQDDILFWHIHQILMMYSIPEGSNVTLPGQIARGQT